MDSTKAKTFSDETFSAAQQKQTLIESRPNPTNYARKLLDVQKSENVY
jgi:hypothetical protein